MPPNTTEHRRIRTRRLRLGLTLRDLAERCAAEGAPIDPSQLSQIERGLVQNPRPRTRAALAKVLGLDPLEIGASGESGKTTPAGKATQAADDAMPESEVRSDERPSESLVLEVSDAPVGRTA